MTQKTIGGVPRWLAWLLITGGMLCVVMCGGLSYLAEVAPDTAVYVGNQVPQEFQNVMKDLDALEDNERIAYFYSDGFLNITDGFYFVSDRRVVIYSTFYTNGPLFSIPFNTIRDVELIRDTSFIIDSEITLIMDDNEITFPVSSEHDRDQDFFKVIQNHLEL